MDRRLRVFCAIGLTLASFTVSGATIDANPENYRHLLRQLAPGDVLQLQPGHYENGLPVHNLNGEPGRPIVIQGPASGEPALFLGRPGHNTVSLVAASHVAIRNLVLDARGFPVAGVRAERRDILVHHITIENLTIVGHGPDQQTVGISTAAPAAYWTIRNNVIVGAGTGMYLGGSDGAAPFMAGLIEGNVVVETTGYNIQIKHQVPRLALPGMPEGAVRTILRGNVFAKSAATSSTGEFARPNLLLGHLPLQGPGQDDLYRVEQNVFYGNPTGEALMQAEGNLSVADNLFLNPVGNGVAIQPHKDVPRQVEVRGNFIAANGTGLRIVGGNPAFTQVAERNEVLAPGSWPVGDRGSAGAAASNPASRSLARWLGAKPDAAQRRPALMRALEVACTPLSLERAGLPAIRIIPEDDPACVEAARRARAQSTRK